MNISAKDTAVSENRSFIPKIPYHVIWGITSLCNAKCIHCYANSGKEAKDEITTITGFRIIDELADLGVFDIGFTGGEPLLRRDICQFVNRSAKKNISVSLSSNGFYVSEDLAKKLMFSGLETLQVSLDGIGKTHDVFRGLSGLYRKAIKALEICKKIGLKYLVCFTATRHNIEQLPKVIDLLNNMQIDTLNISIFVSSGRGTQNLSLHPQQIKSLYLFWNDHNEQQKTPRIVFHTSKMALVNKKLLSQIGFIGCQAGAGTAYIDPEGYVSPCVLLPIRLGNIKYKTFERIWKESSLINDLQNRKLSGKCGKCEFTEKCGGCRAVAFSHYNDPLADDHSCWMFCGK